jgi:hypothetical protein
VERCAVSSGLEQLHHPGFIFQQNLAPLLAPRDLLTLSTTCRSLKPARYCIPKVW